MPRQARLDTPGALHHVIVRGIEKRPIVQTAEDRDDFVAALSAAARTTGTAIYAWALLRNHSHLLVRSGRVGLPAFMRKWLTGYAIRYNHRHHRYGHLFQNRYKSILCEEDAYFRELVRYIHLNPVRARHVENLDDLERYPWCGHGVLLGKAKRDWQETAYVLEWFGRLPRDARRAYRQYIAEGVPLGRRPELVGGGLIRSLGGWSQVRSGRVPRAHGRADERILGSGEFVDRVIAEATEQLQAQVPRDRRLREAQQVIAAQCKSVEVSLAELRGGSRRGPVARLRMELAQHLVRDLGLPLAEAARQLGVTTSGIARAFTRTLRRKGRKST